MSRGIVLIVAFAAAVFLSYFSIRNALAVHYSDLQTRQGYERAVRQEPGDYRNWYLLGHYCQFSLTEEDTARAIQAYLTSLSFNPRSADTWMELATAYDSEGNEAAARNAYLQAKKNYPVSAEVAWQYGNFLLLQGELDEAFLEMHRAVEADHKLGAEAFSRSLRVQPNVEKILDHLLPQASDVYVNAISDQISYGHIETALAVWGRLGAMHARLHLQDAYSLTGDLLRRKKYADARHVWDQAAALAGLVDLQGPAGSLLWDGGFESGLSGGSFTWLYPQNSRAVEIRIDSQEKHSGNHSLRLTFDGKTNINFNDVCHNVVVQPSTNYHFSAWVRTRDLTSNEGIRFQLRALEAQDSAVLVTPDVRGSEPWTQVETSWTSGKDVQEMQICLLRYPSDQEGHRIQGTAWIDDVALVPSVTERSKP